MAYVSDSLFPISEISTAHGLHNIQFMSFYVTVAGKFVNEKRLDIISNNIANSLTAGYKAVKPVFSMVSNADDIDR